MASNLSATSHQTKKQSVLSQIELLSKSQNLNQRRIGRERERIGTGRRKEQLVF